MNVSVYTHAWTNHTNYIHSGYTHYYFNIIMNNKLPKYLIAKNDMEIMT